MLDSIQTQIRQEKINRGEVLKPIHERFYDFVESLSTTRKSRSVFAFTIDPARIDYLKVRASF